MKTVCFHCFGKRVGTNRRTLSFWSDSMHTSDFIICGGIALSEAHFVVPVIIENSEFAVDCALGKRDLLDRYDFKKCVTEAKLCK